MAHTHTHTHTHNGIPLSHTKNEILLFMSTPWRYYAKWNKSDGGRQIPYDFTYMLNLKNKTNNKENKTKTKLTDTKTRQ